MAEQDLGVLTVKTRGVLALRSKNEEFVPVQAEVRIAPTIDMIPLIGHAQEDIILYLKPFYTQTDREGVLRPPADGTMPPINEQGDIELIAPMQVGLSEIGWSWVAYFTPIFPQEWEPFSVSFTGQPGEVVSLSEAYAQGLRKRKPTTNPLVYSYDGPFADGDPNEYPEGSYVLDSLGDLYYVG